MNEGFALLEVVNDGGGRPAHYRFLEVNPAFASLTGLATNAVVGHTLRDVFRHVDPSWPTHCETAITTKSPVRFAYHAPDLGKHIGVTIFSPAEGRIAAVLADITDRKSGEEAVSRYRMLSRHARESIMFLSRDGKILDANEATFRVHGYARDELIGMYLAALRPPESRGIVDAQITAALAGGILFDAQHLRKDGSRFDVEVSALSARAEGEWMIMCIIRDISERKRLEAGLRESEARFRTIFEQAPVGIAVSGTDGTLFECNPSMRRTLGYDRTELAGTTLEQVTPPGDGDSWRDVFRRLLQNPSRPVASEKQYIHKDGHRIWGSLIATLLPARAGMPPLVISMFQDVSERKAAEEEILRLNLELERRVAQRTEQLRAINRELEAFSYSVSHDLKAPLRAIQGFSIAMTEDCSAQLDDQARHYLSRITEASARMNQLIGDLMDLSRLSRQPLNRETIPMSALALEVVDELRASSPGHAPEIRIEEGLTASADPNLIKVVLLNLIGNAWKYTGRTTSPVIEFGLLGAEFFVRDNGAGFPMQHAGKLFSPFQRLHSEEEFPGTGVGLATVQRIINRHGGTIRAEAEVDKGATFLFSLGCTPTRPSSVPTLVLRPAKEMQ